MSDVRKKSPRAPTMALQDALERVEKVYAAEGRHAAPVDVVAQSLGYKSATNGAAAQAIASLRYYGLLERPKDGHLSVSKDYESFKFNPDEDQRRALLIGWLRTPQVFSSLLEKYDQRLPSDATIRFDLISMGFIPAGADAYVSVFRRSVDFAGYYEQEAQRSDADAVPAVEQPEQDEKGGPSQDVGWIAKAFQIDPNLLAKVKAIDIAAKRQADLTASASLVAPAKFFGGGEGAPISDIASPLSAEVIRVPVRLPKGRQAWLELPIPFYESDKDRLKKYIDMQLTDDDEEEE